MSFAAIHPNARGILFCHRTFPLHVIYRVSRQALLACFHGVWVAMIALRMVMILRMTAVITAWQGFPRLDKPCASSLSTGLWVIAAAAAMDSFVRNTPRPGPALALAGQLRRGTPADEFAFHSGQPRIS